MKILGNSNDVNTWRYHQWLQNVNMDRSTVEEKRSEDEASQDETSLLEAQNQKKPQIPNDATLDLSEALRERQNAQVRIRYHKKMAAETGEQREERLRKSREKQRKHKKKLPTEAQTGQDVVDDDQYREWALMIVSKQQTEHRIRKRKLRDLQDDHSHSGH